MHQECNYTLWSKAVYSWALSNCQKCNNANNLLWVLMDKTFVSVIAVDGYYYLGKFIVKSIWFAIAIYCTALFPVSYITVIVNYVRFLQFSYRIFSILLESSLLIILVFVPGIQQQIHLIITREFKTPHLPISNLVAFLYHCLTILVDFSNFSHHLVYHLTVFFQGWESYADWLQKLQVLNVNLPILTLS